MGAALAAQRNHPGDGSWGARLDDLIISQPFLQKFLIHFLPATVRERVRG